jgi:AraC-like DNA-binding protein
MEKNDSFDLNDTEFNKRLLDQICLWIENNSDHYICWAALSERFGLKQQDLQNLFNQYKQTTPMNYLHELREKRKKAFYLDKNRISPIFFKDDK